MKTIIAGSRTIHDFNAVQQAIDASGFDITEVVCGRASGVDALGWNWAQRKQLPVAEFAASWRQHGKAAGPIRNRQMAEYADALILVWDGKSRGSANMLEEATKRGLKIYQHVVTA